MRKMHYRFDITLKDLLKDMPAKFLKILTGYENGKFLDIQLPDIHLLVPDLLIELPDGSLVHIEIQSTNDGTMLVRMYLYSAFIFKQYGRLPRQVVLYVGDKPLNMENKTGPYSYELLDIRDINCSELLQSEKPEDIVLAILCKSDDMDVTIARILEKLSILPLKSRRDYILKLLYLSDLRMLYNKVTQEVMKMPITIDLRESSIFKEGREEGLLEGERLGELRGERRGERLGVVEGMLELKYGSSGLELMDMVRIIDAAGKLEEFKGLIRSADSPDTLKEFLEKNI
jgi:predicted transposase YdaD